MMNTVKYEAQLRSDVLREANSLSVVPQVYKKDFPRGPEERRKFFANQASLAFKGYELKYAYDFNKIIYLCSDEQKRNQIKTEEICGYYVHTLQESCKGQEKNWERTLNAYSDPLLIINHARRTYWNHSNERLGYIALDPSKLIEQRIIALQYLYGVDEETHKLTPYYFVREGSVEKWAEVSRVIAGYNDDLKWVITLCEGMTYLPSMIGISLMVVE